MKHFIYIHLLLLCISANSQSNVAKNVPEIDTLYLPKLTGEFFFENKQYFGEQYYNTEWLKGDILLSTGEMLYDKTLKYNGLFDELIWLNTSNFGRFKLDKPNIKEFWLKNNQDVIHFKQIKVYNPISLKSTYIFAEVAIEGQLSLYIQRKISITGSQTIFRNNVLKLYESIYNTPIYYIRTPTNSFLNLTKLRLKEFLSLFPEKKKNISKLIKVNHLMLKNESDLIGIINVLNNSELIW